MTPAGVNSQLGLGRSGPGYPLGPTFITASDYGSSVEGEFAIGRLLERFETNHASRRILCSVRQRDGYLD